SERSNETGVKQHASDCFIASSPWGPRASVENKSRAKMGEDNMPFYEKGAVRIRYEEHGKGFPLLMISGGGLNSSIKNLTGMSPFNPIAEFSNEYRCIAFDLRNANTGESSGPLEVDRPWDAHADDQLGL